VPSVPLPLFFDTHFLDYTLKFGAIAMRTLLRQRR